MWAFLYAIISIGSGNMTIRKIKIEEIIKKAKENNCFKIAITDHEIIKDYKKIFTR